MKNPNKSLMPIYSRHYFASIVVYTGRIIIRIGLAIRPAKEVSPEIHLIHKPKRWVNSFNEDFCPKFYYETLRKEIEREDNITNQRLTWLMTFQGFLVASMTFLLAGDWPTGHKGIVLFRYFAIGAVGIIGLLSAVISAWGVKAARDSLKKAVADWEIINEELAIVPDKAPQAFGDGHLFRWGNEFAQSVPVTFAIMWVLYLAVYSLIFIWWFLSHVM